MQIERFLSPFLVVGKSIKILLNRVIGPLVFIYLTWSIYQQVMQQPDLDAAIHQLTASLYGPQAWKFWGAIVLSLANWLIEARKWQVLMAPLQRLSLLNAFKGTLTGVAFAINTPNRIGEYGGRMIYLNKEHRLHSIALTMVGSAGQLIVTLVAGLMGVLLFKPYLTSVATSYVNELSFNIGICIVFILTATACLLYFRLHTIITFFSWIRLPENWLQYVKVIGQIPVSFLLRVLSLSAFRYVVFVSQYILLLQALQIDMPWIDAFWLISVLYLILALIPTVTLLELGVRGKTSIILLQAFSSNAIGIYAVGMGIWIINLIIPALAGSFFAARLKLFNTKK